MKKMKRISLIYIFFTFCFGSVMAQAQDMAEPGLLATLACKLNEGRTVQEVIQWGRSNDGPAGAQQIHIRVPVSRFAGFQNLWDFQFAMYFRVEYRTIDQKDPEDWALHAIPHGR